MLTNFACVVRSRLMCAIFALMAVLLSPSYAFAAQVTSISPNAGPVAGGTSVTITGTDLLGATDVKFGGTSATDIIVNSATSITATSPAGTAGTVNVTVTTPGGTNAAGPGNEFTYVLLPPKITLVYNPTVVAVGGTATLTFTITNPNATALNGVTFTHTLAAGLTSSGVTNLCPTSIFYGTTSVYLPPVTLAANASCTIIQLEVRAVAAGVYTDSVTVTAPETVPGVESTATAQLTVTDPPAITSSSNVTFTVGDLGSFTVTATGTPAPTFWISSGALPPGISLATNTGVISGIATVAGVYNFSLTASNGVSPDAIQNFTMTVNQIPTIALNPMNQFVTVGGTASFTAAALGSPSPTVQWEVSTDGGGTYSEIAGETSTTLSFATVIGDNGNQYRAVFTNNVSSATTTAATLTVNQIAQSIIFTSTPPSPALVSGPTYVVAATGGGSGNPVTFTIDPVSAGVCSLSGNTVTFLAAGDCTVVASQAGNANYIAASASQTFTVQDTVGPTAKAIGGFMSDRANLIVSNMFDMNRQIDRLNAARPSQGGNADAGPEFAAGAKSDLQPFKIARLGDGPPGVSKAATKQGSNADGASNATALESFLYSYLSAAGESRNPLAFNYSGAINARANFGEGAVAASFKTSLSQMVNWQSQQQQAEMQSLGLGHGMNSSTFMPLDIWVEGNYATYNGERSGKFGMLSVGADYVVNPGLLAGLYGQFDSMKQTSGTDISGTGWMAGPYATLRLSENVFWQGRGGWGASSNEISNGAGTDHFDSTRWLLSSSLSGRWDVGNGLAFAPTGSFTYFEDRSESYVDSSSVFIPGVKTTLGQIKLSPELSYAFTTDGGLLVEPDIATELIWNFASTNIDGLGALDDTANGPKGLRGRVKAGIKVKTISGITFGASGAYDGIGSSGFHSVSGNGTVSIPLN